MSTQTLKTLNKYWQSRNRRERVLALAVGLLLLGMAGYSLVQSAVSSLRQLDAQIRALQDGLVNAHYQVARRQMVERQYSRVAAQHSSAWTEPEVQERLRQEIYRLAKKTPPPLNADGIPEITSSDDGNLVEIPGLRQGTLSESEEGDYRQYSISFEVPPALPSAMFAFLERLQNSPQSLRIDGLELIRPPESTLVGAKIQLARIIVDGAPAGEEAPQEEAPAVVEPPVLSLNLAEWSCEGCAGSEEVVDGAPVLVATATEPASTFYASSSLPALGRFEITVDMAATGEGALGIASEDGAVFPGATPLKVDAGLYRYTLQFTVPGEAGETRLRLPVVTLTGEDATARIHAVSLKTLSE